MNNIHCTMWSRTSPSLHVHVAAMSFVFVNADRQRGRDWEWGYILGVRYSIHLTVTWLLVFWTSSCSGQSSMWCNLCAYMGSSVIDLSFESPSFAHKVTEVTTAHNTLCAHGLLIGCMYTIHCSLTCLWTNSHAVHVVITYLLRFVCTWDDLI